MVGTRFDAHAEKGKGNQDLLPWMAAGLRPNPGFEVRQVDHPDGRVVLFEVGPAKDQPVAFYGTEHVRIRSSKTELARHPEKERSLWTRGSDWSAEVIDGVTPDELEPEAIAVPDCLTEQQKLRRINNLLQELRRSGAIVNRSSRTRPGWVLTTLALPVDDAT